eukprot:TRINITY_DN41344_c0_g1_i1.p1 TRINITY_DN41344_c0_g1~~TRINITY_DN41344_c0_g1_i1.p1  ORF type:complete len:1444 (-),score=270.54 TRINITY_DN41344_c0_g1_i1:109-4440(-)
MRPCSTLWVCRWSSATAWLAVLFQRLVGGSPGCGVQVAPLEEECIVRAGKAASLSEPRGISVQDDNSLLVVDKNNYRLLDFQPCSRGDSKGLTLIQDEKPIFQPLSSTLQLRALAQNDDAILIVYGYHKVFRFSLDRLRKLPGWQGPGKETGEEIIDIRNGVLVGTGSTELKLAKTRMYAIAVDQIGSRAYMVMDSGHILEYNFVSDEKKMFCCQPEDYHKYDFCAMCTLKQPRGIAFVPGSSRGEVIVSDTENGKVVAFQKDMKFGHNDQETVLQSMPWPTTLAVDDARMTLWIAYSKDGVRDNAEIRVMEYSLGDSYKSSSSRILQKRFAAPLSMAVSPGSGGVVVSESEKDKVWECGTTTTTTTTSTTTTSSTSVTTVTTTTSSTSSTSTTSTTSATTTTSSTTSSTSTTSTTTNTTATTTTSTSTSTTTTTSTSTMTTASTTTSSTSTSSTSTSTTTTTTASTTTTSTATTTTSTSDSETTTTSSTATTTTTTATTTTTTTSTSSTTTTTTNTTATTATTSTTLTTATTTTSTTTSTTTTSDTETTTTTTTSTSTTSTTATTTTTTTTTSTSRGKHVIGKEATWLSGDADLIVNSAEDGSFSFRLVVPKGDGITVRMVYENVKMYQDFVVNLFIENGECMVKLVEEDDDDPWGRRPITDDDPAPEGSECAVTLLPADKPKSLEYGKHAAAARRLGVRSDGPLPCWLEVRGTDLTWGTGLAVANAAGRCELEGELSEMELSVGKDESAYVSVADTADDTETRVNCLRDRPASETWDCLEGSAIVDLADHLHPSGDDTDAPEEGGGDGGDDSGDQSDKPEVVRVNAIALEQTKTFAVSVARLQTETVGDTGLTPLILAAQPGTDDGKDPGQRLGLQISRDDPAFEAAREKGATIDVIMVHVDAQDAVRQHKELNDTAKSISSDLFSISVRVAGDSVAVPLKNVVPWRSEAKFTASTEGEYKMACQSVGPGEGCRATGWDGRSLSCECQAPLKFAASWDSPGASESEGARVRRLLGADEALTGLIDFAEAVPSSDHALVIVIPVDLRDIFPHTGHGLMVAMQVTSTLLLLIVFRPKELRKITKSASLANSTRMMLVDWPEPPRLPKGSAIKWLLGKNMDDCPLRHPLLRMKTARESKLEQSEEFSIFGWMRWGFLAKTRKVLSRDHPLSCLWNATPWLTNLQRFLMFVGSFSLAAALSVLKLLSKQGVDLKPSLDQLSGNGLTPAELFLLVEVYALKFTQYMDASGIAMFSTVFGIVFSKIVVTLFRKRLTQLRDKKQYGTYDQQVDRFLRSCRRKELLGGLLVFLIYVLSTAFVWMMSVTFTKMGTKFLFATFAQLLAMKVVVVPVASALFHSVIMHIASCREIGIVDRFLLLNPDKVCFLYEDFPDRPDTVTALMVRDYGPPNVELPHFVKKKITALSQQRQQRTQAAAASSTEIELPNR